MKLGCLKDYFTGVAFKRMSAVEVDQNKSNQHEFNGSVSLKKLLGDYKFSTEAMFTRFSDTGNESEISQLTWYDARDNHPTRSEYRLYFKSNRVMDVADSGDLLILIMTRDGDFRVLVTERHSTVENQIKWLLGIEETGGGFVFNDFKSKMDEISYTMTLILREIGVSIIDYDNDHIDTLIQPFLANGFPTTKVFSEFARSHALYSEPVDDPDSTILEWMKVEEKLFRRMEKHIVSERILKGFGSNEQVDVDSFIHFSLSVQNRRKARVGHALENHLEEIFKLHDVRFDRGKITENHSKPDFLFPDIHTYHEFVNADNSVTVLGVKSTCKDRWRQVLAEADKVKEKHLFTLEPGITVKQTDQMQHNLLQLVVPEDIQSTYSPGQSDWLLSLKDFIHLVKSKEKATGV